MIIAVILFALALVLELLATYLLLKGYSKHNVAVKLFISANLLIIIFKEPSRTGGREEICL